MQRRIKLKIARYETRIPAIIKSFFAEKPGRWLNR